jgi:hypothetical protein
VIEREASLRQVPSVLQRDLGDEVLLALPGRSDVDVLTGGAAMVWRLLDRPVAASELIDAVAGTEEADRTELRAELDGVVADLRGRGLIEEVAG